MLDQALCWQGMASQLRCSKLCTYVHMSRRQHAIQARQFYLGMKGWSEVRVEKTPSVVIVSNIFKYQGSPIVCFFFFLMFAQFSAHVWYTIIARELWKRAHQWSFQRKFFPFPSQRMLSVHFVFSTTPFSLEYSLPPLLHTVAASMRHLLLKYSSSQYVSGCFLVLFSFTLDSWIYFSG